MNALYKIRTVLFAFFSQSKWEVLRKSDVLVVRHDANCGYNYKGMVYSPIIDTIVDICFSRGVSVQSVASPYSKLVGTQAYNSPVTFNRSFIFVALFGRVVTLLIGDKKGAEWVTRNRANIWLKILQSVDPKIVISIQAEPALCRAGRMMGISVYDYQHGVIDRKGKWYGELLTKSKSSDLPHGFLCWDQPSAEALSGWAAEKGSSVTVVGHPWFQRFSNVSADDSLAEAATREYGRIFNDEKPVILVALQWGLHIHYYPEETFNKVLCDALESVIKSTNNKYNWLLRLHPVQLRGEEGVYCERYLTAQFSGMTVEWKKASNIPLPILLAQTDLHITDMSTVVVEASWFGIPSALLNPFLNKGGRLEGLYEHERVSGIATLVPQNSDSIISWIEEHLRAGKVALGQHGSDKSVASWLSEALDHSNKRAALCGV
jgi:hypothetical protein